MGKVLMTEDFTFNVTGASDGRISKQAGEVFEGADWLCEKLVNDWKKARWHQTGPKQTKTQSATYRLREKGAGWYELVDEDGDVVDKIRGEKKANDKLNELNG